MNPATPPDRCRIVLVAPDAADDRALADMVEAALAGGDVASLILPLAGPDEAALQARAEKIVPLVQASGAAAIVAGDRRIALRTGADGVHVEAGRQELADAVSRLHPKLMVGAGGARTRDKALELGEVQPDYMFFGRFGYDRRPEPHARMLELGRWWAQMISIPCIVQAGSELASARAVAAAGAEFVALSAAIFADGADPSRLVAEANALLDEAAPDFEDGE